MGKLSLRYNENMAKVTFHSAFDKPGIAASVFSTLGEHGINVELISSVPRGRNRGDISFAVLKEDLETVLPLSEGIKKKIGAKNISHNSEVSLISIYGEELSAELTLTPKFFRVLADKGVNLQLISHSLNTLSCLIAKEQLSQALTILRETFDLEI